MYEFRGSVDIQYAQLSLPAGEELLAKYHFSQEGSADDWNFQTTRLLQYVMADAEGYDLEC